MATLAGLCIRETTGISRDADVIISGVPLERGTVPDARRLVLRDEGGRRLRMQADVLARWHDGSAKWVHGAKIGLRYLPRFGSQGGMGFDDPRTHRSNTCPQRRQTAASGSFDQSPTS